MELYFPIECWQMQLDSPSSELIDRSVKIGLLGVIIDDGDIHNFVNAVI